MESYRSHYSKDVTSKDHGKSITVAGWVEDIRNIHQRLLNRRHKMNLIGTIFFML